MRISMADSIADAELSEEHWRILRVLSDERGRSMGELAELVLLNHPALTKNIDKLVARGLVQRAPSPDDNRKVVVYISDLGLQTAAQLNHSVDLHHDLIEQVFGQQKTLRLKRLLEDFIKSAP